MATDTTLSPLATRILRSAMAAIRPRGHGFDQAIDDALIQGVADFLPYLPAPMRRAFPLGLSLLEFGAPVFGGGGRRMSGMPLEDARHYLEGLHAAGGLRAALVLGVRTLILMTFYQHPDVLRALEVDWEGRARTLTRRRAELLGGPGASAPPEHGLAYPNVTVGSGLRGHHVFSADVVIVGTGAGGATTAHRLRTAGRDVLLLEEGGLHRVETFDTDPPGSIRRLYRDAGTSMILGTPPIIFAEGRCVGGSTVINGGMSWRTPARVLEHWERDLGLDGTGPKAMEPYFAEAERILHVEPNHEDTFGQNTHLFLQGASALGWPVARAPRNMHRCVGLNNCALGCPTGAKQGMHVTEVPRALAAGAAMITHTRVDRVTFSGTRATGVRGNLVTDDGRVVGTFEARGERVVLAAGARCTPGILKRSGLGQRQIGRGLHTHPNAKCVGVFDRRIDPWIGTHQAFHIHHFLEQGILIGYAAIPPGLLAAAMPGLGPTHAERMARYNHMLTAATLVEDDTEGRIVMGPDRQPYMVQNLGAADIERIHRGVALTAELLFAAGAERVLTPFADLPELANPGDIAKIATKTRVKGAIELMTVHIMGTARMANDPARGVTDARGAVHDVDGLFVADGSLLPSSIGVNPQETIIAMALRNADRWIAGGR